MKPKLNRITAALLLCVMLLAAFAGCSEETSTTANETTASSDAAETTTAAETLPMPEVPDADFEGEPFRICSHQNSSHASIGNFEFYAEAENGEVVNDAVYRRNVALEERFNTVIEETRIHDTAATFTQAVMSGDEPHDVYVLLHLKTGNIMTDGGLYNIYDIPHIDLEKPWWSRELGSGMAINGKLYFLSGDILLYEKMRTYCLLFNKELITDLAIDDPYRFVFDGSWTLDTLRMMMQGVSADLNGDGEMNPYDDRFGLGLSATANVYGFLMGADVNAVTENNGNYEFTLYSDRLVGMLDKLISVASDPEIAFASGFKVTSGDWSAHSKSFYAGNLLFNSTIVSGIKAVSQNAEFDYGVLPMPKYDEAQEFYRTSSDREMSAVLGVPVNASNIEKTGIMLEAMCGESHYTTRVAYIETSCKTKYTYDESAADVLDIIFENTYYNLGTFYNLGGMNEMLRKIVESGNNTIASDYAAIEDKAKTELEELIGYFD